MNLDPGLLQVLEDWLKTEFKTNIVRRSSLEKQFSNNSGKIIVLFNTQLASKTTSLASRTVSMSTVREMKY